MHPVLKLITQRVALGVVFLFAASILIFVGTTILPGDVAQSILGQSATPQSLANLRAELGLNDPPVARYFAWLGGMFLAFWAALISVPLAILLGLIAVRYRDRWPDKLISGITLTSISIPEFLIGYVLMFFVAVKLGWAPSVAMINDSMSLGQKLNAIALPVAVLTLVVLAHMMRMTRAAILNVMQSAYIETAELKGLSTFEVIRKHAFPNAIAPIVNVVMLNLAYLVVGVVVIEVVFTYPGMGQYLVDHVSKRDVPVVQACGLIFAAVYISLNMIADIVSILANPRLRHPK